MTVIDRMLGRLPWPLQKAIARMQERALDRSRRSTDPADTFGRIYAEHRWGAGGSATFYSGWGSHEPEIVQTYVKALSQWARQMPAGLRVVDLGCGDFNIGRQLRPLFGAYVACDVVPSLVEHNRKAFAELGVEFRVLDITSDALPPGDVVFIRQVLQHLGNEQIAHVVPKLAQYRYIVLTEHLPQTRQFEPNLDKGAGDDVRAGRVTPSAVVLTEPPFSLRPGRSTVLCEVDSRGGRIETILYEMPVSP